ncbi:hypothetical protein BU23DRAFT_295094 [Bimuria novae-zelandiae CBS 107.79]|uniref:Uncharacterized protein n=1 Tax=Bimuria novae-zelandiae CBS 107.79 TaxID=1447943 RepID=A0A6A5VK60_9PLEO|nr:hypothetical protein BU23DRAFT_295094 [Bimuria novae-zelandiae CBS 107.79]
MCYRYHRSVLCSRYLLITTVRLFTLSLVDLLAISIDTHETMVLPNLQPHQNRSSSVRAGKVWQTTSDRC